VIIGAGGDAAHQGLPVLIVTGLKQEARIAAGPGLTVICSSSNPYQLREMMMSFDPASIRGIVSFGVAGGLNPTLRSGDIVIASEIVAAEQRWTTASNLNDLIALSNKGRNIVPGVLAGVVFTLGPALASWVEPNLLGGGFVNMLSNSVDSAYGALRYPVVAALSSFVVLMIGAIFALLFFVTRRFADLSMSFRSLQS